MARGDSLARQIELWQLLEDRGRLVVAEVARELGYTARTVYRDLSVLERIGVPIYQERRGRRSRWRVVEGYRRRLSLTLSWLEMVALVAGRRFVGGLAGSPLERAAESAIEKIRAALPKELVTRAEGALARVTASVSPAHDYAGSPEALGRLLEALEHRRTMRVSYRKPGERRVRERVVDPYHIHLQGGALYVLGWDHGRRAVRTFLLDRIQAVAATGEGFEPPADFSPSALLQGSFGPWSGRPVVIRLCFDRTAAALVTEQRFHASQMSQWRSDGKLDVSLNAPIGPALVAWILGWGARVRVLAPRRLAEAVRREHERACRTHP